MKKILYLIPLLLLVFIPKNTYALSYTASDGNKYDVQNEKQLLDWCYFNYDKEDYKIKNLILTKNGDEYNCGFTVDQSSKFYFSSLNNAIRSNNPMAIDIIFGIENDFTLHYDDTDSLQLKDVLYSTTDIYDSDSFSNTYFPANTSIEDIINSYNEKATYTITYFINDKIYKTFDVEEGSSITLENYDNYNKATHTFSGWQYDNNIDLNNITSNVDIRGSLLEKDVTPVYVDFPINKNEFYVLLFEVGILIIMLFLKWCFPNTGGRDL